MRFSVASLLVLCGVAAACARAEDTSRGSASEITAGAKRSIGLLPASNGLVTIAFDGGKSRVTQFSEHAFRFASGEAETRNFAYDTYPGIRVGREGTWLPDAPAKLVEYVPGTGIIHASREVSGVTVDEYHFAPMTLAEHASVMLVKITRTAGAGPVDAYGLFNYRVGSGGPAPSPENEQGLYVDSRQAVYEWGPANVAMAYGSIGPVTHHAMSPSNPWEALRAGENLADNGDTAGARSDAASGLQTALGDLPNGKAAWAGWYTALDPAGDAQAAADRVRAWVAGRSPGDVFADEVASWKAWTTPAPSGASEEEAQLFASSQAVLRMAQVREAGSSHGQILATLAPGKKNITRARDMAYATVALVKSGHLVEAKAAIDFQLQARAGVHQSVVGKPYKISAAGYFGNGSESPDVAGASDAGPGAPSIAFDGFGLFLWSVDEYVKASNDAAALSTWWPAISGEVAEVLRGLQEPSGLIAKDSSIWEARFDGSEKNFAFTTIAAAHGLCSAARLADRASDTGRAEEYRKSGTRAIEALRMRMRTADGALVQSPQALGAGAGYTDAAVVEAINFGLFHPKRASARATMKLLQTSLVTPSGKGFARGDSGRAEDSQDWVFGDLRIARALALAGDERAAGELLGWSVAQARANSDTFAVAHDRENNYVGEVPAVGMGAGAFILTLTDRGRALEPSCGAYADEPAAPDEDTEAPSEAPSWQPGGPSADEASPKPTPLTTPPEARPSKLETSCQAGRGASTTLLLPWLVLGALALSRRWRRRT